jgi:hypothetical protein
MAGQGLAMPVESVRQVIHLLSLTEMTASEIAERMSCSKSTVISINRRFQVRAYNGRRSSWIQVKQEVSPIEKEQDPTEYVEAGEEQPTGSG